MPVADRPDLRTLTKASQHSMLFSQLRGGAVRQLVGLITQRSLVQIRPPLSKAIKGLQRLL